MQKLWIWCSSNVYEIATAKFSHFLLYYKILDGLMNDTLLCKIYKSLFI